MKWLEQSNLPDAGAMSYQKVFTDTNVTLTKQVQVAVAVAVAVATEKDSILVPLQALLVARPREEDL